MLSIIRLATENLMEECVTDNRNPRFSFTLESDKQDVSLVNAAITVNDWSIVTKEQILVPYAGKPLKPFTEYTVTVHATDNYGESATASMSFATGRLEEKWQGKWITDATYNFTERKTSPKPMTFRKKINGAKKVKGAKMYATALGIYEMSINGVKVGKDYFAPGLTSYKHQLQYNVYDVTEMLTGKDTIVAVVSGGWAVGSFTYRRKNRITAKRQAILCELRIEYEDGSKEIIGSDESWQVTEEGNYKMTEFYDGETYDATVDLEKIQWKQAGEEVVKISPAILANYGCPVRAHEVMKPVSAFIAKSGMIIFDFGQNFAGVIHAVINGKRGQVVKFCHTEILMNGELYTEPLRSAKVTATYTCIDGEQTYSPKLTYMGFRYVGVSGIESKDLELTAFALYSNMPEIGSFQCSNEMINKLQSNICWGAKSNFMDIPTDCPQRDERMGWTGDIALFAPTANFNFDMSRFFDKWLLDVKSEQLTTGGIPVVVPRQGDTFPIMAIAYWGDCCILVPWAEYLARGDKELLRRMYPTMKRYLKAVKFWASFTDLGLHRRIWRFWHQYGDWCAPGVKLLGWMLRGKWTATACWANSCNIVSKIAGVLGEEEDQKYYRKLQSEIAEQYRNVLTDKKGKLKKEFQTAYVLPLYYDMFEGEEKKKAAENLVKLVKKEDYHIGTGFPGTPYILFALADNGYIEDAFKMLLQDSCPSWLYEVKAGGTTIWERWDALREDGTCNTGADDGTNGMVSFNHYASGAVGDFLYRRIAGIETINPGYKKFKIAPIIGGGITYAKGSLMTPYGSIKSRWNIENDTFHINVEVPVGTKCTLILPNGKTKILGSGKYEFEEELSKV